MHISLPDRTLKPPLRLTRIPGGRHLRAVLLATLGALALAAPALAASELFVRGAGYGHGVGMSQYGAYGYALHGWNYRSILKHYYMGTSLGTVDPHKSVTVLLATGSAAFRGATRAGGKKLNPALMYDVRPLAGDRLRLVEEGGKLVGSFAAPLTATGPGPLTVPGLGPYRGALEFRPAGSGRVETIDALALDDYVRGVVAAEMPSGWSMQALEAQAVAARTYAITTDAGGSGFDQYSDTRSQAYGGVRTETPRSDAAVAATRGRVVTYRGRPAVTYFSSSSGGHTENNEDAFSGAPADPWLRGVRDPYDSAGGNPNYRWMVQMSGASAASKLGSLLHGTFVGIAALSHGVSPRIATAQVVGSQGTADATGTELEQLLALKSTWARFTTITTVARPYVDHVPSAKARAAELAMPLALVRVLIAHVAPISELTGTVFPGSRGARIAEQERRGGGWRTIRHASLGSGGAYAVQPPGHGTYRIVYQGLDGPAVRL